MTANSASPESPVSDRGTPAAARAASGVGGHVRTAAGRPIPDVVVMVQSRDTPSPAIPEIARTTNTEGRYFWPLPPGRYTQTFMRNGAAVASRQVDVPKGRGAATVDVVIDRR